MLCKVRDYHHFFGELQHKTQNKNTTQNYVFILCVRNVSA